MEELLKKYNQQGPRYTSYPAVPFWEGAPTQQRWMDDLKEEKVSENKYRILEGNILKISDNGKEIRKSYQEHKKKGLNVLFSLPTTPIDFIIEDVPVKGILQ